MRAEEPRRRCSCSASCDHGRANWCARAAAEYSPERLFLFQGVVRLPSADASNGSKFAARAGNRRRPQRSNEPALVSARRTVRPLGASPRPESLGVFGSVQLSTGTRRAEETAHPERRADAYRTLGSGTRKPHSSLFQAQPIDRIHRTTRRNDKRKLVTTPSQRCARQRSSSPPWRGTRKQPSPRPP